MPIDNSPKIRRSFGSWSNRPGEGEGYHWILDRVAYQGDDCIEWPFSKSRGHGHLSVKGKRMKAARLMCELVNGPPPTPKYETAHSCGRGHFGCMTPRHLSWKTRTENQRDRREHGTAGKAAVQHLYRKLTEEQVSEIRAIGDAVSKEELGRRYSCTPANIAKILDGRTWPGVLPKEGFYSR
jgi:hypothetical protein